VSARPASHRLVTATWIGVFLVSLICALGAAPAKAASGSWRLYPNETLGPEQRLLSTDGRFALIMQADGNLVEYASGRGAVWASNTFRSNSILKMQDDGNLVVIAPGNVPVWASGTNGNRNAVLELQNDGNAVVYAPGHVARWGSGVPIGVARYPWTFAPSRAASWAAASATSVAPDRISGDSPCTSFASQAMRAAGMPVDHPNWIPAAEATAVDKYINPPSGIAAAWYNVQRFRQYFIGKGWMRQYQMYPGTNVYPVALGDVIYYEWNGQATNTHVHMAVVTSISNGQIFVSDQNGEANIGSVNRRWDISGAPATRGQSLITLNRNMRAYVLHWS
jgi:hypothetical protein